MHAAANTAADLSRHHFLLWYTFVADCNWHNNRSPLNLPKAFHKASLGFSEPSISTSCTLEEDLESCIRAFAMFFDRFDACRQLTISVSAASPNEECTHTPGQPPNEWKPLELFRGCDRWNIHLQFW
jgi:hypothetical protein